MNVDWQNLLNYDPETGEFRWRSRDDHHSAAWNAKYAGKVAGARHSKNGYIRIRTTYAHRLAWFFQHKEWPQGDIDHINGDKADNRIVNLRVVDRQTNMQNAPMSKVNTSGATGVRWHKRCEKWAARITVDGRDIHLGVFADKRDAILARKKAERKFSFHPNHGRPTGKLQQDRHG